MSETTTLSIGGAELTVPTDALFRAWFERHITRSDRPIPSIPAARPDERYFGSIIEPSGRVRHSFLLPGDTKKNWNDGMAWAKDLGGDLPEEFQKEAYWSNTQHAGDSHDAWFQSFNYGHQDCISKSAELRVRAVRREFSDSVI